MHLPHLRALTGITATLTLALITAPTFAKTPVHQKVSPLITPKTKGVLVLFSGKQEDLDKNWTHQDGKAPTWILVPGNAVQTKNGSIITKEKFMDAIFHVEFKVPYMPEAKGQGRGNSGVIIQGCYEVQVLDSYGKVKPGKGDCGAVYNTAAPLVNACKKPLEWQSYDIIFRAPRFDAEGKKTENAHVTVILNGVLVQNNTEIPGSTGLNKADNDYKTPGPLLLQFHGNAVQFRNVWALHLPEKGSDTYE